MCARERQEDHVAHQVAFLADLVLVTSMHTQTHVPHLHTRSQERGQKAQNNESERQENHKARTSQTQTQNPSAPVRPSRAHGIGRDVEFLAIVTSTTTAIEVRGTNSPLPSCHSILFYSSATQTEGKIDYT